MKSIVRIIVAVLFVAAGVNHFVSTDVYVGIMPPYLPYPRALVLASGVFEILGGVGLLIPRLRRAAGVGLVALLLAVYPANVHMAVNDVPFRGGHFPAWAHGIRLALQFIFIAVVLWVSRPAAGRDVTSPAANP